MFVQRFASWDAFYQHTLRPSPLKRSGGVELSSKRENTYFMGCSVKEAHEMAQNGWAAGALEAREMSDGIVTALSPLIERFDVLHDVEGQNLDIARYLDGEPECWMQMVPTKVEASGPYFFRVVIGTFWSGAIDQSVVAARGACAAALIELLELAGARVELISATSTWPAGLDHSNPAITLITIKRFDEPLDMPKVAFAIGHPATFRCHGFANFEVTPELYDRVEYGSYGGPRPIPDEYRGDVCLDTMDSKDQHNKWTWLDSNTARQWVRSELERFGVKFRA